MLQLKSIQEVSMNSEAKAKRLAGKSRLHRIQVELQQGYNLSPVEAQVLARRVQQLVDEQTGTARQPGQVSYQVIAVGEPAGKPLAACRKVPVQLSLVAEEDGQVWASQGPQALRRLRVERLVYEALLQGGVLSQEDLATLLGISRKSIQRIFADFREQGQPLPSRGEIEDIGRGVSHKIPVIRRYVQDMSFSRISLELHRHGFASMVLYLRHFALVMVLEDQGLSPAQMRSVVGISPGLIEQYQALYVELNVPAHARTLARLKQTMFVTPGDRHTALEQPLGTETAEKRGCP
jgi:AraC-like DNA-binding protein